MSAEFAAVDRPLRVLRVLTRPNLGGPTRQAIALWHAHRDQGVETLLVTGEVDDQETTLSPADHGVPTASLTRLGPGWLQLAPLRRSVAPLADLRARGALRRLMRAYRPDVVHTHTSKAGAIGRRAAAAEGVPVVAHTFHGHVLDDYFGRVTSSWLRRLERRLAARTDLLFAVSSSCADELAAHAVARRDRIRVLPPAVAAAQQVPRAGARTRLGIAADAWRVAAVGRLVPIKRLDAFVDMVARSAALGGDLLGDGPLRGALAAQVARCCPDRVRMLGARPDAAEVLSAYDALVVPSVREGCPLVTIEAFAAGVPVVGFDVPGVRDALAQLGRGILVPSEDGAAGLLRAVDRLRQEPRFAADLVAQSRVAVRACRPELVAASLADAYRRALRGT